MSPFFVLLKIGFIAVLWCCSHIMLKKIKGSGYKNGDIDGTCKRALNKNKNPYFTSGNYVNLEGTLVLGPG